MKLGLLGNNRGRSRTKNLHELLAELHGLNATYPPMAMVGLTAPVPIARQLV